MSSKNVQRINTEGEQYISVYILFSGADEDERSLSLSYTAIELFPSMLTFKTSYRVGFNLSTFIIGSDFSSLHF